MWIGQATNARRTAYVHVCKNRDEILAGIDEQSKTSNTEIIVGSFCVIFYLVLSQKNVFISKNILLCH